MVCSSSLVPGFVNNDYVRAESICSTANARHEVPTWSWATLSCRDMGASPKKAVHTTAASRLCPLSQPREKRIQRICFYGSCASQERIPPWLLCQPGENKCLQFLWLLESSSSLLAHSLPGFSEQCEQQDNRCHKQGRQYLPHFLFMEKSFQRADSTSY